MYHVGRPGEDGFTERVLAAWGVDGHNSHTNVCSSSARAGYQLWSGIDRPSPDHANAKVILLVSAHLETGHYFNPHAQRIIEAKQRGAKLDRVRHAALEHRHARRLLAGAGAGLGGGDPPGDRAPPDRRRAATTASSCAAGGTGRSTWRRSGRGCRRRSRAFEARARHALRRLHLRVRRRRSRASTPRRCARSPRWWPTPAPRLVDAHLAQRHRRQRGRLAGGAHALPAQRAARRGGARRAAPTPTPGTSSCPKPIKLPPHPTQWNELTWPVEYPLSMYELSFLLPHFLKEGRGKLEVYFTRVYNPVWTNPDGFSWIEMLHRRGEGRAARRAHADLERDRLLRRLHPADGALAPSGTTLHSYETHDAQWLGFRQPVLRAARERQGEKVADTRETNPGEVWEENEFWLELSWRIDRDGALGIRPFVESEQRPGERLSVDEYYGYIFEHSVPGLPEKAAAEGLTPLAVHAPLRRLRGQQGRRARSTRRRCRRASSRTWRKTASAASTRAPRRRRSSNLAPTGRAGRRRRGPARGRRAGRRRRAARLPDAERPARVLLADAGELGLAGDGAARLTCRSHVHPQKLRAGPDGADLDLPPAGAHPHAQRQRQVARRDRPHQPALAPPARRGAARRRRPATSCASKPRSATTWSRPG